MQIRAGGQNAGHDRVNDGVPVIQVVTAVLWPSFLLAGAATGVFFSLFDPVQLLDCTGEAPLPRLGAYTIGFFGFWLLAAGSSAVTSFLLHPVSGD